MRCYYGYDGYDLIMLSSRYVGGSYTPLDLMMNDFWFACTEYLPLWLAPNMVTHYPTLP